MLGDQHPLTLCSVRGLACIRFDMGELPVVTDGRPIYLPASGCMLWLVTSSVSPRVAMFRQDDSGMYATDMPGAVCRRLR
jgi:hypothetical protein